jgi:hypothetical protein
MSEHRHLEYQVAVVHNSSDQACFWCGEVPSRIVLTFGPNPEVPDEWPDLFARVDCVLDFLGGTTE